MAQATLGHGHWDCIDSWATVWGEGGGIGWDWLALGSIDSAAGF